MNIIIDIFYAHKKRYGYCRIALKLRNMRYVVNHKKVKRLISVMGLYAKTPKAKYKSYKGDRNGTVKNLLLDKVVDKEKHKTYYERNFHTTECNEIWVTDVLEFHIAAGKLYLSPILDLHNREIVSFHISTSPNFKQIEKRKRNGLDNAPMKNFFERMKNEMFYGFEYTYETLEDVKIAMEEYIEYYNTERITVKLKGLTPIQYRNQSLFII